MNNSRIEQTLLKLMKEDPDVEKIWPAVAVIGAGLAGGAGALIDAGNQAADEGKLDTDMHQASVKQLKKAPPYRYPGTDMDSSKRNLDIPLGQGKAPFAGISPGDAMAQKLAEAKRAKAQGRKDAQGPVTRAIEGIPGKLKQVPGHVIDAGRKTGKGVKDMVASDNFKSWIGVEQSLLKLMKGEYDHVDPDDYMPNVGAHTPEQMNGFYEKLNNGIPQSPISYFMAANYLAGNHEEGEGAYKLYPSAGGYGDITSLHDIPDMTAHEFEEEFFQHGEGGPEAGANGWSYQQTIPRNKNASTGTLADASMSNQDHMMDTLAHFKEEHNLANEPERANSLRFGPGGQGRRKPIHTSQAEWQALRDAGQIGEDRLLNSLSKILKGPDYSKYNLTPEDLANLSPEELQEEMEQQDRDRLLTQQMTNRANMTVAGDQPKSSLESHNPMIDRSVPAKLDEDLAGGTHGRQFTRYPKTVDEVLETHGLIKPTDTTKPSVEQSLLKLMKQGENTLPFYHPDNTDFNGVDPRPTKDPVTGTITSLPPNPNRGWHEHPDYLHQDAKGGSHGMGWDIFENQLQRFAEEAGTSVPNLGIPTGAGSNRRFGGSPTGKQNPTTGESDNHPMLDRHPHPDFKEWHKNDWIKAEEHRPGPNKTRIIANIQDQMRFNNTVRNSRLSSDHPDSTRDRLEGETGRKLPRWTKKQEKEHHAEMKELQARLDEVTSDQEGSAFRREYPDLMQSINKTILKLMKDGTMNMHNTGMPRKRAMDLDKKWQSGQNFQDQGVEKANGSTATLAGLRDTPKSSVYNPAQTSAVGTEEQGAHQIFNPESTALSTIYGITDKWADLPFDIIPGGYQGRRPQTTAGDIYNTTYNYGTPDDSTSADEYDGFDPEQHKRDNED